MGFESTEQAAKSGKKWFSYNKGGDFKKWYGNNSHIVNYEEDGRDLKIEVKAKYREKDYAKGFSDEKWDKLIEVWVLKNQQFYYKPSVTWTYISSAYFGARYCPQGFIFDVGGSSIFPNENEIMTYTGLMCSKLSTYFLKALNPTLNFQVENIAAIPVSETIDEIGPEYPRQAIKIAEIDWDSYETSWDFTSLPLLNPDYRRKRKINPTPALRQNLCASGVGIPLPLTDQENLGYDLIRKGWENGSQRLTRRAVEISRARIIGQIRESGYVERKGDRDVP